MKNYEPGKNKQNLTPAKEAQRDSDIVHVMELQIDGFKLAGILETRLNDRLSNWSYGDPEAYIEQHLVSLEPEFSRPMANAALDAIRICREDYGTENVAFVTPTDHMMLDYCYPLDYKYNLIAILVRPPQAS